jgi:hypothetical protein
MNGSSSIKQSLQGIQNININGDITASTFETTTSGNYLSNISSNVQNQLNNLTSKVNLIGSSYIGSITTNIYVNPPNITSNNFTYSGSNWNAGTYKFSSSSNYSSTGIYYPFNAFNQISNRDLCFVSASGLYSNTGTYIGTTNTTVLDPVNNVYSVISGEWLQIQLPLKIILTSYQLLPRYVSPSNCTPFSWFIAGSNDGVNWVPGTVIDESALLTGIAYGDNIYVALSENGKIYYSQNSEKWNTCLGEDLEKGKQRVPA